jgi:hypothetical protein
MYKSINFNILILFSIILWILNFGCNKPIGQQKQYLHTLEQLAHQRGKFYVTPQNSIVDIHQREIIIKEYKQDSIGNLWNDTTAAYNKRLIIQSFDEYPNRYLITDTANYGLNIMEIPLQTQEDSASELIYIYGKHLGYMIDTMTNSIHKYLVVNLTVPCEFSMNELESISYSDVLVLYDIQGAHIFPIEILDYKCSQVNAYEKGTYKDVCFCNMNHKKFISFLYAKLILSYKIDESYPWKFKKFTKRIPQN